ncbi:MAG: hypothetical protein J7L37_02710 [Thermococcus sp.]|nr:hypothetical protein [Thermococcus sp.]
MSERFRKKPVTIKEILSETDPVRKAYLLGYLLGYSGHLAWSGWARELKNRVFMEAEASNVLSSAFNAFKKGRREGASDRERAIVLGSYRPLALEVERSTETVRSATEPSKTFGMLSARSTGEAIFLGFLGSLNSKRHLRLPSFLRKP